MTGAVGHKRVAKEFIEAYPIPVPPIPEQKRIVAIIDEAFEGIDAAVANAEKNLANANELFESWEVSK
jgi:type I restriction enzyme, S subunit